MAITAGTKVIERTKAAASGDDHGQRIGSNVFPSTPEKVSNGT